VHGQVKHAWEIAQKIVKAAVPPQADTPQRLRCRGLQAKRRAYGGG